MILRRTEILGIARQRLAVAAVVVWVVGISAASAFSIGGNCWPNRVEIGIGTGHAFPRVRAANARWVRITIPWRAVNPAPGQWNFQHVDHLIGEVEAA